MDTPQRPVYRREELQRLFAPRSVAVIGASAKPESFGSATLANFRDFKGEIFAIHPSATSLQGRLAFPSVLALPAAPDLAVLAVPRTAVEEIVLECAEKGVGGVVIYASGYHETGICERSARQERLVAIAREAGMRLLGPNTMGFVNAACKANASFLPGGIDLPALQARAIGLVCQSGAIGFGAFLANQRGVSFSHVLTAGNSADVDVADEVAYLAQDDACTAIACLFEGLHSPGRLLEAARIAWANDKPLILFKMGTGPNGIAASSAHTGTPAGNLKAYRGALEETGAVVVEDYDALLETAAFFSKAPRPTPGGAFIFSSSGGAAIIAADQADALGVELPQPSGATLAVLESHIPEYGSSRNPCDVTATVGANVEAAAACYEAVLSDPAYSVVVTPIAVPGAYIPQRLRVLGAAARRHGKFACVCWLSGWLEGVGSTEAEQDPDVALFRSPRRCFETLNTWFRREALQKPMPPVDFSKQQAADRCLLHPGDNR